MIWTPKIEFALQKAAVLHDGQKRYSALKAPHFSHTVAVMLIASAYTKDEDILSACILHDTVEDTQYTQEQMEVDFGGKVSELVRAVTDTKEMQAASWVERHDAYKKRLLDGPVDACFISASDKIHNFYSTYSSDSVTELEHLKKSPTDVRIQAYGDLVEVIEERLDNPITKELKLHFNKYKSFLESL